MVVDFDDSEPGAPPRGSRPFLRLVGRDPDSSNDNRAMESADETADAVTDASGSDGHPGPSRSSRAGLSRRRGPLITRWIGFAARRQRAQERTDRLARERACPNR